MNPIDDDTLQAYVDGELDASTTARIDAALAHDDALARRVQQARALRSRLRAAFDPVLDEPVPQRLSALLQPSSAPAVPSARSSGHRAAAAARRVPRRWLMPGVAAAASVAAIALALWWWQPDGALVRMQDGQAVATGVLEHALDHALASEPDARAEVAIGLSFRGRDGHVCRSFVLRTHPAQAGLACHRDAGWSVPVLGVATDDDEGQLRQAASALPPDVQAAVDARLRGEVFDARQERAARDAGWR